MAVPEVYAEFDSKGITQSHEMARVLRCSVNSDKAERIIADPAEWPGTRYLRSFGSPTSHESIAWFNYVRMAIDAGYYGLATVDYASAGGPETNHWVLICGARTEGCITGKVLTGDVLTSCSVNGEQWYEAREFLTKHGGYDVLFVRPRI